MCQEECTGIDLLVRSEGTMQEEQLFGIYLVVVDPPKNCVGYNTVKVPDCGIMYREGIKSIPTSRFLIRNRFPNFEGCGCLVFFWRDLIVYLPLTREVEQITQSCLSYRIFIIEHSESFYSG